MDAQHSFVVNLPEGGDGGREVDVSAAWDGVFVGFDLRRGDNPLHVVGVRDQDVREGVARVANHIGGRLVGSGNDESVACSEGVADARVVGLADEVDGRVGFFDESAGVGHEIQVHARALENLGQL